MRGVQRRMSRILTSHKSELLNNPIFIHRFGNVKKLSIEIWGACTSIRVFYDDMEVEFGIVEPSWMDVPLDAGTQRTLIDGYEVILDKMGYFNNKIICFSQKGTDVLVKER